MQLKCSQHLRLPSQLFRWCERWELTLKYLTCRADCCRTAIAAEGVPEGLSNLQSLTELDLDECCSLSKVPASILALSRLQKLTMRG